MYRPPAQRGDIYRALQDGYSIIVLIDGEFHGCPSVWQREIADAMAEGAVVHGASSMGALRAAELHTFGMIGHGRIFEWYRDGIITSDDEVALTYTPAADGYRQLSEPLVNIRATLAAAVPDLISEAERDLLIEGARAAYFPERSFEALLAAGTVAQWPADRRTALEGFLSTKRIDQKRDDAVAALTAVAREGARPSRPGTSPSAGLPPSSRLLWVGVRLAEEGFGPLVDPGRPAFAERLGMSTEEVATLRNEVSAQFFVCDWARANGITASTDDLSLARATAPATTNLVEARREALLTERALVIAAERARAGKTSVDVRRSIILDWASANGIEHDSFKGDSLVDWIVESGPGHFGYWWFFDAEFVFALQLLGRAMALSGPRP